MTFHLSGQSHFVESLGLNLIGPDNVNIHYKEQQEFYLNKYSYLLDESEKYLAEINNDKHRITQKKRLRKGDRLQLEEIEEVEMIIVSEMDTLIKFVDLWSKYKIIDNQEIFRNLVDFDCLEVVSERGIYSPHEYTIVQRIDMDSLLWNELSQPIVSFDKSTRWVKRKQDKDCVSVYPQDCLVWVLEETQLEDRTSTCPESYSLSGNNLCIKSMAVENKFKSEDRRKIYSLLDNREFKIEETRKVNCK